MSSAEQMTHGGESGGVPGDDVSERITRFLAESNPPTPCLVVDLAVAAQRYRMIRAAMPFAVPYYAVKANPAPELVRLLVELGSCFDVASPAEVDRCLDQGADPDSLSYGNTIKKASDIAYAYARGVRLFAFDNIGELQKLARAAPGASVFCRLLADSAGARWPLGHKFGCSSEFAVELLRRAAELGLRPRGLSFHVGSQQTDPSRWDASVKVAAAVFAELDLAGIELTMLNIGGGYPARYLERVPPIGDYGTAIGAALDRWFGVGGHPTVISEPGRFIAADAGVLRTQVVSVRRPCRGGDRWVYLDAGRFGGLAETEGEAILYRLATYQGGRTQRVVLAGPTCDSADVMYRRARYALPLALDVGDTVDFLSAGAYTASYSSVGFNGFAPLASYFIPEGLIPEGLVPEGGH